MWFAAMTRRICVEKTIVEVPTIYAPAGQYSHAISVRGGRTVYLSGVVGKRPDGSIAEGDVVAQAEQAFQNLGEVLRAAGATFHDIVKVNIYVGVDFNAHAADLRSIRARYLTSDFPTSTLVQVAGFAGPEYLYEIEAVAIVADEAH
jgi:enamine deaminase RidA (YjgF/YER057c/UK114 family)